MHRPQQTSAGSQTALDHAQAFELRRGGHTRSTTEQLMLRRLCSDNMLALLTPLSQPSRKTPLSRQPHPARSTECLFRTTCGKRALQGRNIPFQRLLF